MKVLLTQEVPNVGHAGETKDVADGYARNFLLPRKLATVATIGAVHRATEAKQSAQKREARARADIQSLATNLSSLELTFKAKVGDQHRLFGSITAADIADELSRKVGHAVDKRHVALEEPIRQLGSYKVPVHLAPKVNPAVTVIVEAE